MAAIKPKFEKSGRLVPIGPTGEKTKHGAKIWAFQCDCGNIKVTELNSYNREKTQSCGCLQKERTAEANARSQAS